MKFHSIQIGHHSSVGRIRRALRYIGGFILAIAGFYTLWALLGMACVAIHSYGACGF